MNLDHELATNALPAILIGGVPDSGKSVLTYNLTRALRHRDIPHYVFRANPDGQGDWLFEADPDEVRQLYVEGEWSDEFRQLVRRDISRRLLPLIVDIGGLPHEKDHDIFHACTHSALLIRDGAGEAIQTWRTFTTVNGLTPLAEIHSQLSGPSVLTSQEHDPVITGSITFGQGREERVYGEVFDALVMRIARLFGSYSLDELEQQHMKIAPVGFEIVHLDRMLDELLPSATEWSTNMLERLFSKLPPQAPLALYGRGPVWLYGALALYSRSEPFYQFDPRFGWITPPHLQSGTPDPEALITIRQQTDRGKHMITILPRRYYLDYKTEADQLVVPDPLPQHGVIVSGKLPFWLFTALARFYAQRDVPWIALHSVSMHRAIVIYSRVAGYSIGDRIILPA